MENNLIFTLSLFLLSFSLFAQDLETFKLKLDGKEVDVTQNIDSKFLGEYVFSHASRQWKYFITKEEESFYQEQEPKDAFELDYAWDNAEKQGLVWGILVEDGAYLKSTIHQYADGQMTKYDALMFIYQNKETEEYGYMTMYEKDGTIFLGKAFKERGMASAN